MRLAPATERKFHKQFIGDFTFDSQREQYRARLFLNRNVMRVLAYHERRRTKARAASPKQNQPDSVIQVNTDDLSPKAQVNQTAAAKPKRTSLRNVREQFPDEDAELILELRGIRKKLNFNSDLPVDEERPRKRIKRDSQECQCHVAIWDNREGFVSAEPVVKRSLLCSVTSLDGPSNSRLVDIEMNEPFRIKARELFVDVNAKVGLRKALGEKYFLETKIIPCNSSDDWPPIPLLSKSDVTMAKDVGKNTLANIEGTLVSSYANLPRAPASDVPLSVSFVQNGQTYKTRYGMEVLSTWTRSSTYEAEIKKQEEEIPSPPPLLDVIAEQPWPKRPSISEMLNAVSKPAIPESNVRLCFSWDTVSHDGIDKKFRKSSVDGFRCPACRTVAFGNLKDLQFHFMNNHQKYKFTVQDEEKDPTTGDILRVNIKVEFAEILRQKASSNVRDERQLYWEAPRRPFDLDAYLDGDHTWVGDPPRRRGPVHGAPSKNSSATLRESSERKSGFLPADKVSDLPAPRRRRHKVVVPRTKDQVPLFRSISHRPLRMDESPLSESDEDIDEEWIKQKHCEMIDDNEQLSENGKEFRKRWDSHLMKEHLPHGRYISDSLIRFVRANCRWLRSVDIQNELEELLGRLKSLGLIDEHVVFGCWKMINNDHDAASNSGLPDDIPNPQSSETATSFRARPPDGTTCATCYEPITKKRQAIFCGNQVMPPS